MTRKRIAILLLAGLCLSACGTGRLPVEPETIREMSRETGAETGAEIPTQQAVAAASDEPVVSSEPVAEPLVISTGETLAERIRTPEGYERIPAESGSLADFLRNYPMKEDGSPVCYYDGRQKTASAQVAVFDMYLGERDLQQCADSVMRVYAEYLRAGGRQDEIAFHFVSGFLCDYRTYLAGGRVKVNGNQVSWASGTAREDTDETFEAYLNTVFNYASTISLAAESEPVALAEVQPGDIFIKAGSPGHVVMVADVCEKDGKKAMLLAQGYMPAQDFHVLKNNLHEEDPWYYEDEIRYPFATPEYVFSEECLKRPGYLR